MGEAERVDVIAGQALAGTRQPGHALLVAGHALSDDRPRPRHAQTWHIPLL